jgi:small subunit ribosomal protein S16
MFSMSVMIRLSKMGKRGEGRYRVVVTEKRYRRDGKPIETLGWYEKREKSENKEINKVRLAYWLSKGARPSSTVEKIISKNSV